MNRIIGTTAMLVALSTTPDGQAGNAPVDFWTYLGGSGLEIVNGVAVDPDGNIYLTGETWSSDLPVLGGVQANLSGTADAFVIKLAPDGQPIYVTYLGGGGFDSGRDIAADAAGNAYVVGYTESVNFPLQNALDANRGGFSDAFIVKINPQGNSRLFGTYFGGSDADNAESVDLDTNGNIYVVGRTRGGLTPTNAAQATFGGVEDAFVLRLDSSLTTYDYITYLGGDQIDVANAIAVNAAGIACVAGFTASLNFPEVNASQSAPTGPQAAFYAAISSTGSILLLSSTLGGTGSDVARDVACNADLLAAVGNTTSTDFPTGTTGLVTVQSALAGETDGFIAAFELSTGDRELSTYAGGRRIDRFSGIVFTDDHVLVAYGDTASSDFPDVDGAPGGLSGAGVFRSTNAGVDWQTLNFYGFVANDLTFAPATPERIIAATDFGVQISDDDGATWQRPDDPLAHRVTHSITVDPEDACTWIAGVDYDPADVTAIGAVRTTDCGDTWSAWGAAAFRYKTLRWLPDPTRIVATVDRAPGFSGGTQADTCVYDDSGGQVRCMSRGDSNAVIAVNHHVNCEWFEGSQFGSVQRVQGVSFCDHPFGFTNITPSLGSAVTALVVAPPGGVANVFGGTRNGKLFSRAPDAAWIEREAFPGEVRAIGVTDDDTVIVSSIGAIYECEEDFKTCPAVNEDTGSTPIGGLVISGNEWTGYTTRARDLVARVLDIASGSGRARWSNDGTESQAAPHGLDVESFDTGPRFYMNLSKANSTNLFTGTGVNVSIVSTDAKGDEDVGLVTSSLLTQSPTIFESSFEDDEPPSLLEDGFRAPLTIWW